MPIEITDPADSRIGDFTSLTDPALRMRVEPSRGLFIAEGELILRRALAAGHQLRSVLIDHKHVDDVITAAGEYGQDLDGEIPLYVADYPILEAVTGFHVHRGLLAAFSRPTERDPAEVLAGAQRVVIVENVNNHTNLGSMIRSAAALGMDAVLLSPSCVDPLYRRVIRVSMGQVFAIPFARLSPWPDVLDIVKAEGFTVIATTPATDAVNLRDLPKSARRRPALLLGAEGPGLTPGALAAADVKAAIGMHHGVDSLNVAVAAAVACYELGT